MIGMENNQDKKILNKELNQKQKRIAKVVRMISIYCMPINLYFYHYLNLMSSVEDSERDEDSLSNEEPQFLKTNRLTRHRSHHRSTRTNEQEDQLYHEAFRIYMFGGFEKASDKCKRIIAMNPQNPKPYFLLATMHEEVAKTNENMGQLHKAVEYYFFDAFYSAPDIEKWLKVGEMSYELQLYQQAAYCYGRVLKINNSRIDISLRRAQCLELCNESKKAGGIYKRIIEKVSNSVQVYKKYAKLLFSKRAYSKARQILRLSPDSAHDTNIKYMICQTLLKEKKYEELYKVIEEQVINGADPPIQNIYTDLAIPFIQMILICTIALPEELADQLSIDRLWKQMREHYEEEENPQLYEELISHTKQLGSIKSYQFAEFLLSYPSHKTINNYMFVSEHLRHENLDKAIKIINQGLKSLETQNSIQLRTQLNFLKSLKVSKNKKGRSSGIFVNQSNLRMGKNDDQIFQSDEEFEIPKKNIKSKSNKQQQFVQEEVSLQQDKIEKESDSLFKDQEDENGHENKSDDSDYSEDGLSQGVKNPKKKNKKIKKYRRDQRKIGEIKNPQVIQQLIKNSMVTLQSFKDQYLNSIEKDRVNPSQALKHFIQGVSDSLNYIINIQGFSKSGNEDKQLSSRGGIFSNKNKNKRKRNTEPQRNKINLIIGNEAELVMSVKYCIFFMKEAVKSSNHRIVLDLAELLSRAHFFKWQNKMANFQQLKVEVYETAIVSCLALQKYKKSLFFIRFLVNKFPNNTFYITLLDKVTRYRLGKLTLNTYLKKDTLFDEEASQRIYLIYLRGVEEMDNGFFELALNMFTNVLGFLTAEIHTNEDKVQNKKNFLKVLYLNMSTCFLQLASSRTVYNKLEYVNRSAYCLGKYEEYCKLQGQESSGDQILYNKGRWYSHVKAYRQAIRCYQQIDPKTSAFSKEAGLNLMVIYKEMEEYNKVQYLSQIYFSS